MKVTRVKRRKVGREVLCGLFCYRASEISKACKNFSHGTKYTVGEYSTGGAMKNRDLTIVHTAMDTIDFDTADMASMMRS